MLWLKTHVPESGRRAPGFVAVLAVFEPAEHFGEGGLFAIHEDAYAVDSAGYPEDGVDGRDHDGDGEGYLLTGGMPQRDAHVHDEGAAEWDLGDDARRQPIRIGDNRGEGEHAASKRHYEDHVELLELLLGVDHGSECGGDAGVEKIAEQKVDDEEDNLACAKRDVSVSASNGRDDSGMGENDSGREPDGDLGQAYGSNADDLSGHHLLRADGGKQDLEDARRLLFDDGARDVHPVEQDDHVHEQEEDVDGDEAGGGVGVLAGLSGVDFHRLE